MNFELFLARRLYQSKLNNNSYSGPVINICKVSIAISIIIMIITISTGFGLKRTITQNLINAESHIQISHINLNKETQPISIKNENIINIIDIIGVKSIDPIVKKSAVINKSQNIHGVILKGVETNYKNNTIKKHLVEGRVFSDGNKNEMIISVDQVKKIGLKVGEFCVLYFLSKNNNIQKRKFLIVGIYDLNNQKFNETYAFCKKGNIQKINKWTKEEVTNYEVTLSNEKESKNIVNTINNQIEYNLTAHSLENRFPGLFNWVMLFDKNILFILIIMCIICLINMTNTLLILIIERLKMIGTLKSFGCSNYSILKIFLYNSFKISLHSLCIGNVIALFVCYIQQKTNLITLNPESYFLNYLPIIIDIKFIIIINIITFIIIQLSIVIPYFIIKKLSPTNILKIN